MNLTRRAAAVGVILLGVAFPATAGANSIGSRARFYTDYEKITARYSIPAPRYCADPGSYLYDPATCIDAALGRATIRLQVWAWILFRPITPTCVDKISRCGREVRVANRVDEAFGGRYEQDLFWYALRDHCPRPWYQQVRSYNFKVTLVDTIFGRASVADYGTFRTKCP